MSDNHSPAPSTAPRRDRAALEQQVRDFLLEHDVVAAGAEFVELSLGAELAPLGSVAAARWRQLREVLLRQGQTDAAIWAAP